MMISDMKKLNPNLKKAVSEIVSMLQTERHFLVVSYYSLVQSVKRLNEA